MQQKCLECGKTFGSAASLNFHTNKIHSNKNSGQNAVKRKSNSDEDTQAQTVKKPRGRPPILKFSKIPGATDYTKGPFKLIGCTKVHQDLKKEEKETVRQIPTASKSPKAKPRVLKKTDEVVTAAEVLKVDPMMPVLKPQVELSPPSRPRPGPRSKKGKHWKYANNDSETKAKLGGGDTSPDTEKSPEPDGNSTTTNSNLPEDSAERIISTTMQNVSDDTRASSAGSNDDTASYCSLQSNKAKSSHKAKTPACPVCDETEFRNMNHYRVHIEIHEGKRPFICQVPKCGMGYEDPVQLIEHVSIRHDKEKRFPCEKCGTVYMVQRSLVRHQCPSR